MDPDREKGFHTLANAFKKVISSNSDVSGVDVGSVGRREEPLDVAVHVQQRRLHLQPRRSDRSVIFNSGKGLFVCNKLECSTLAGLASLVQFLRVRLEPSQMKQLKLLALPTNT